MADTRHDEDGNSLGLKSRGKGIAFKLMIAFSAIIGTSLVSVAVGLWSTDRLAGQAVRVAEVLVPAIGTAGRLSQQAVLAANSAERLSRAANEAERMDSAADVRAHLDEIGQSIERLERTGLVSGNLPAVVTGADGLRRAAEELDRLVSSRIRGDDRMHRIMDRLGKAQDRLATDLRAPSEALLADLGAAAKELADSTAQRTTSLLNIINDRLVPLYEAQTAVLELTTAVEGATATQTTTGLDDRERIYVSALQRLNQLLPQLEGLPRARNFARTARAFDEALTADGDVFALVRERANVQDPARRAAADTAVPARLKVLELLRTDLIDAFGPLLLTQRAGLDIGSSELNLSVRDTLEKLFDQDLLRYRTLLELSAVTNQMVGLLSEATQTTTLSRLEALRTRFQAAAFDARKGVDRLAGTEQTAGALATIAAILTFSEGDNDIFGLRSEQVSGLTQAQNAVTDTARQAEQLVQVVQIVVDALSAAVAQATDEGTANAARTRTALAGIAGGGVVLALLILWLYVYRNVAARLEALALAMRAIARGDLSVAFSTGGGDEITGMARALLVLRDASEAAAQANGRVEAERAHAAVERRQALQALADRFEVSVKSIADTVAQAAGSLQETAHSMVGGADTVSRRTQEATASSARALGGVQISAAAAAALTASIGEVERRVALSTEIAGRAVVDARRSDTIIQELATAAGSIGSVVEMIDMIAGQTSLLALNASIEAARSGEAGRGFSVVASEVKLLAGQTAKATAQIAAQIAAMQAAAQDAVAVIGGITATVQRIDDMARLVSEGLHEQSEAIRTIDGGIQEVARESNALFGIMNAVATTVEDGRTSTRMVATASESMKTQSHHLNSELTHFAASIRSM